LYYYTAGASGAAAFTRAGGTVRDLVETSQGVRAQGPPAALATLAAALEYHRPENENGGGFDGGDDDKSGTSGGIALRRSSSSGGRGGGTYSFGNFGKDEVAMTLAAGGGGASQQHRAGVSVRAGCRAERAKVSGDGIKGHAGPAGAVTSVEVACRDGWTVHAI
jgi:hypothetical protein